ncbi:E3 ubiquitin-protein ligase Topors-like [Patagioenas fasciata monilis]|uniref:E3 ubiquitin-protein ligase Topors n=1 Tax=Patagioenas fasciata monilis TaxID=372326 RepID=A0A1V4JZ85_PATFA|nr:E3 ubiquitin-protein ligase Topors-like [Patagioenas fasciata monilis]
MAVELHNRCPICLDSWEEASYVMPCLHQFCYACILRWAQSKPECPLCKRRILSILHSVLADNDFEEYVIASSAVASVIGHQAEGGPGHPHAHTSAATQQQPVEQQLHGASLGNLQPITWAFLFRDQPALLQPLLPWVRQELRQIFGNRSPRVAMVEDALVSALSLFGLHEEILLQVLHDSLQNQTATFVPQLINIAVQRCSGEAYRLLALEDGQAAEERESSPPAPHPAASQRGSPAHGPDPSGSPAGGNQEERPSTSTAVLHGGPRSPPEAPVPTRGEQEEPHEDLWEAAAGPSTPSWDRNHSPGRRWRALNRRVGSSQDSSQTPKRPHQWQK